MFRRSACALSPRLTRSSHPKIMMNWRNGHKDFFNKPKYSASKMKWNFELPYRRAAESLFHYPEVSAVTGKAIDWYHAEPEDGYEGVRIYGEHTLELRGMPLGRTPEYVQERLRRFFSKFGPVRHCRAEPHPLDPYQCEGRAFVSFRDRQTALRALRAPLKFPASLHDKVVSMRHLDSDKRNDPDYREKCKFWDGQLLLLARDLHEQLLLDAEYREQGKPLEQVELGLFERELVALPAPEEPEWLLRGRGGVPLPKGLHGAPTRLVPAGPAVRRRFGSWESFLAEPPLDLLFSMSAGPDGKALVQPRLVTKVQRSRLLFRLRMALEQRLHGEFSIWWREGKIPLPEYTQRRVDWLKHKPHLPWELQIMSRSKHLHRIFDERYLYKMQIVRARNAKRREKRAEWTETRKEMLREKERAHQQRRQRALTAVEREKVPGLLGTFSPKAVRGGGTAPPGSRAPTA